ncbi:MAG: hypothetical protein AAFX05_04700 [Planctomycetota bacterium]
MEQLIEAIADDIWILIPLFAITIGCTAGIVSSVAAAYAATSKTRAREESRREIAAYVAEGSMTPEDADLLLKSGSGKSKKRCGWV